MHGTWWLTAIGVAVAVCAGVVAALVSVPGSAPGREPVPAEVEFVIEAGTSAAAMRGEPVTMLPPLVQLRAGQTIVVRNEDQAMHYFFDAPIAPGASVRRTFSVVGTFGYRGGMSCSVEKAGQGGVVVEVGPR